METVFMNTQEAASFLKVSRRMLEKYRISGGGPKYIKAGARVIYRKGDLLDWVDARTRRSTSDPGQAA